MGGEQLKRCPNLWCCREKGPELDCAHPTFPEFKAPCVVCADCGLDGPGFLVAEYGEEEAERLAIAAWNTRQPDAEVEALRKQVSKLEGKLKATGYLATASIKDFKKVAEALGFQWDEMTEPPDVHEFVEKHVTDVEALRAALQKAAHALGLRRRLERTRETHATLDPWTVMQAEGHALKAVLEALQPAQAEEAERQSPSGQGGE